MCGHGVVHRGIRKQLIDDVPLPGELDPAQVIAAVLVHGAKRRSPKGTRNDDPQRAGDERNGYDANDLVSNDPVRDGGSP
jgi:hypothetical protein